MKTTEESATSNIPSIQYSASLNQINSFKFFQEKIEAAYDYSAYRQLLDNLLAQNKTTGLNQSEKQIGYAQLNQKRMQRLEKTVVINDELRATISQIKTPMVWLVITEGWCGDAAQNLPAIAKMAELSPLITLRLILRDENLDLMDQFLTSGARAIPKLIALHAHTYQVLGTWGPRPSEAQKLVIDAKAAGIPHDTWSEQLHKWYADNKNKVLQQEFEGLIRVWAL